MTVSRLIRVSYGDYDLNTIPTGMAIEVPVKPLENQKRKGRLLNIGGKKRSNNNRNDKNDKPADDNDNITPIQWVRQI